MLSHRGRLTTLLFTVYALVACDQPEAKLALKSTSFPDAGVLHGSAVNPFDAGPDAGTDDAGIDDGGAPVDAGTPDAGDNDAGPPDGGIAIPDAGAPIDAGSPDGGPACIPGAAPDFTNVAYYASGISYGRLVSVDLDGDGLLDLITTAPTAATLTIFFGQADGGLSDPTLYSVDAGNDWFPAIAVGDLNGDGLPDLVVGSWYTPEVAVYYNLGRGVLSDPSIYAAATSVQSIGIGDFNGDGLADLVLAEGNGSGEELLADGNGSFALPVALAQMQHADDVVVADFDSDGLSDIASSGNAFAIPATVLINEGDGGFQATTYPLGGTAYTAVGLIPRVGGAPDLINTGWVGGSPSYGVVELMQNNGGAFGPGESYSIPSDPAFIASGDVDGDCIPDVLVAGWCDGCGPPAVGFLVFLPGYDDGGFGAPTQLTPAPEPTGVAFLGPVGSPRAVAITNAFSADYGLEVFGDASSH